MEVVIRIHDHNGEIVEFGAAEVRSAAQHFGLDKLAPSRYSSIFVVDLLLLSAQGIDPDHVIREIKALEGLLSTTGTKPAAPFTRKYLKGLWHKHFFAPIPSVFAHNIINQFCQDGLSDLVNEIFDPAKSPVVTLAMINELSHRITVEQYEKRYESAKLTGEWIVFGKSGENNYYLTIATHASDDRSILERVKVCSHDFPSLNLLGG